MSVPDLASVCVPEPPAEDLQAEGPRQQARPALVERLPVWSADPIGPIYVVRWRHWANGRRRAGTADPDGGSAHPPGAAKLPRANPYRFCSGLRQHVST